MKKVKPLFVIVALISLLTVLPSVALANTITIDPIEDQRNKPTYDLTISGSAQFPDVTIKLFKGDTLIYFDVVQPVDGNYSLDLQLIFDPDRTTYTVVAGLGNNVAIEEFEFYYSGGGGGGGSAPPPVDPGEDEDNDPTPEDPEEDEENAPVPAPKQRDKDVDNATINPNDNKEGETGQVVNDSGKTGNLLPGTATANYTWITIGLILLMIGVAIYFTYRYKKRKSMHIKLKRT